MDQHDIRWAREFFEASDEIRRHKGMIVEPCMRLVILIHPWGKSYVSAKDGLTAWRSHHWDRPDGVVSTAPRRCLRCGLEVDL